jgi:hypothetical protein
MFSALDTTYTRMRRPSCVAPISSTRTRSGAARAMASSTRSCSAYCVLRSPRAEAEQRLGTGTRGR